MAFDKEANIELMNIRSCFDPILGYSKTDNDIPGYDIFPPSARMNEANIKILVTGGSTSTWPIGNWSRVFGELLINLGQKAIIFNGAAQGYTSGQELLKVIRDAPGLKPTHIISLSGVNDLAFMQNIPSHPLLNKYQNYVSQYLVENAGVVSKSSLGIPVTGRPYENWLRNVALIRSVAQEYGIECLCCLQPTSLYGNYVPSAEETAFIEPYANQPVYNIPYEQEVTDFYDNVRNTLVTEEEKFSHVWDLSGLFAGKSNLYKDYRHQNAEGDSLIAQSIFGICKKKGWF